MQIDDALLSKLENLSHLHVADDKREEIIAQLSEIVSFVDNLSELDTTGVSDTFSMTDNGTLTREDTPSCNTQVNENIISNSPKSGDNYFIVPKIIE
ncbi:MAG: Asp-tRNA(Asn)/Glu-tRNA(Gln) amidotransferase subunit GatC [Helicobacteraceae bacterium]|nr:Asp-tRNA(Asn)/Glu-tRNA(Gln) amidotransferase subunit GatC [Helicobacteraceae bacterium]